MDALSIPGGAKAIPLKSEVCIAGINGTMINHIVGLFIVCSAICVFISDSEAEEYTDVTFYGGLDYAIDTHYSARLTMDKDVYRHGRRISYNYNFFTLSTITQDKPYKTYFSANPIFTIVTLPAMRFTKGRSRWPIYLMVPQVLGNFRV